MIEIGENLKNLIEMGLTLIFFSWVFYLMFK